MWNLLKLTIGLALAILFPQAIVAYVLTQDDEDEDDDAEV
jgi:hypothetical protein